MGQYNGWSAWLDPHIAYRGVCAFSMCAGYMRDTETDIFDAGWRGLMNWLITPVACPAICGNIIIIAAPFLVHAIRF